MNGGSARRNSATHADRINTDKYPCLERDSNPRSQRSKTVHALDRAATVTGHPFIYSNSLFLWGFQTRISYAFLIFSIHFLWPFRVILLNLPSLTMLDESIIYHPAGWRNANALDFFSGVLCSNLGRDTDYPHWDFPFFRNLHANVDILPRLDHDSFLSNTLQFVFSTIHSIILLWIV
jgi:hypothetical protein